MIFTSDIIRMIHPFKSFKPFTFLVLLPLFISMKGFDTSDLKPCLIGTWESDEKNLQIEMFDEDGTFAGKMIFFKCSTEEVMKGSKDIENPDKALRHRKLLGMKLVTQLTYKGNGIWDDGKIYDPNSGHTFDARITLTGPNTAVVRGYWKYRWLGRSMVFNRM
jgi:uncharacterized protein (DUF2147 family)